jgi:mRNA-degrading endonuclease RelE of RelBE toxin-antitoxin system
MVSYHPVLHRTAKRELDDLDASDRERLTDVFKDVAETRSPTTHEKVRQLEGQTDLFRVRVGTVRAICTLQKPELRILRIGHRQNVYDVIDGIDDRRATA